MCVVVLGAGFGGLEPSTRLSEEFGEAAGFQALARIVSRENLPTR